mmetsp:Transcript_3269/g.7635  ORF Transcript_3269/g.7635 Transcript_3269/m.7635 type:complete len:206 (+) Transcript_3269:1409-2026(+)
MLPGWLLLFAVMMLVSMMATSPSIQRSVHSFQTCSKESKDWTESGGALVDACRPATCRAGKAWAGPASLASTSFGARAAMAKARCCQSDMVASAATASPRRALRPRAEEELTPNRRVTSSSETSSQGECSAGRRSAALPVITFSLDSTRPSCMKTVLSLSKIRSSSAMVSSAAAMEPWSAGSSSWLLFTGKVSRGSSFSETLWLT